MLLSELEIELQHRGPGEVPQRKARLGEMKTSSSVSFGSGLLSSFLMAEVSGCPSPSPCLSSVRHRLSLPAVNLQ